MRSAFLKATSLSRKSGLTASVAAALLVTGAFAGRGHAQELIALGKMTERLGTTARISGKILAGLNIAGREAPQRPYIEAFVPESWAGSRLCLKLVSNDGLYEGFRNFRVSSGWKGGKVRVPLETAYASYLSKTQRGQLASLLSRSSCEDGAKIVTATSWNETMPNQLGDYTLQINSYRADEVYVILGGKREIVCNEVRGAKRTAFDFTCVIPAAYLRIGGETEAEINRVRRGQFDLPETVSISLR